MRILVALLFSVLVASANPLIVLSGSPPVAAGGGPTFIADVEITGTGGGAGPTADVNTTGATLIVAAVHYAIGATIAFGDNMGNTYTGLTARVGSVSGVRIYYCLAPNVGSGHNFTVTGLNIYAAISIAAFSGINAFVTENGATASSSTIATGSVAPGGNNRVFVTGLTSDQAGATATIGSSFIETADQPLVSGNNMGGAYAYKIQTTGASENPTWTSTASGSLAAAIAVFSGP